MSPIALPAADLLTQEPVFWVVTASVVAVLLLLNLLVIAAVHVRGVRERSRERRTARFRPGIEQTFAEIRSPRPDEERLRATFTEDGVGSERLAFERSADMRYAGQEHTVNVPIPMQRPAPSDVHANR